VIGAMVPAQSPYWLGTTTLGPLMLSTHRYLEPGLTIAATPPLPPVPPTGRVRRGLMVYDGGQF